MPRFERRRFRKGDLVTFKLPPGWLEGLPEEDQREIRARVGKPVAVQGYRRGDACVELVWWEYKQKKETKSHSIWLERNWIKPVRKRKR